MFDIKKIIKVLSIFLIIIVIINIGGCIFGRYTVKQLEDKIMKRMEEKYADSDDTFTMIRSHVDQYEFLVLIKSKKYPNADLNVRYYYESKKIIDNYMAYVFQEDVEEAYKEIFDKVYGEGNYTVENKPGVELNKDYSYDTPFEEYLNTIYINNFRIICIGDPDKKDEKIEEILKEIVDRNWGINMYICYVDASYKDKLDTITFKDVNNDKVYKFSGGLSLYKDSGYENALKYHWLEGKEK